MNGKNGSLDSPLDTEKSVLNPVLTLDFRVCRHMAETVLSCFVLGNALKIPVNICKVNNIYDSNGLCQVTTDNLKIGHLKKLIWNNIKESEESVNKANQLMLWEVEIPRKDEQLDKLNKMFNEGEDIKNVLGEDLDATDPFTDHFHQFLSSNINIIVKPPPPTTTAGPLQDATQEEVLENAKSYWMELKDKLVKKIELKKFIATNHIYEETINASEIPIINGNPSLLLHALPNFSVSDNNGYEGYVQEEFLSVLFDKVMKDRWFFIMGTSGSGKTRSLFELLCRTYGIYFSLNVGNGSKNLGSQDMDIAISGLGQYLTADNPKKNTNTALKFTRAMLLGRLFILINLLEFHSKDYNRNFTPKQWLLMQLLPRQICGEDFWVHISRIFRRLNLDDQDELVTSFIKKFESLIPQQKQLPIAIDESQAAIKMYEKLFSTTLVDGPLRPFFAILLRTVLNLSAGNLCLVLSGTGMSFDDIKIHAGSAIAKSGGATFKNFFSMHDGFYECSEMSKFIQRFLPLDDELMKSTFNIFQGRRRFVVQFLEHALSDPSSMSQNNVNESVKNWQCKARDFIIRTFMESCFPYLHKKKEAWNKVLDIVIFSMFSHCIKLVKGDGVAEMVQYGFAQLCSFEHLADLNDLQMDAISIQIAEPIPILAFREYMKNNSHEFEAQLLRNLCSVHYNASCAGFLFEPYLTIALAELFNGKSCKEHYLFTNTNIEGIDKLELLLSCKATIRNLNNHDSTMFCSNGNMTGFNLPAFLNNPVTAFFMPEKDAGPDLVCIIEFHTPNGIVEVPLFLQAKLVKDSPKSTAIFTTDPRNFYSHGNKQTELKKKLRDEVLDCLNSKYCKAHELSWIRFLVVYPADSKVKSTYIYEKVLRPKRMVAVDFNDQTANELLIVIDPSNAEHFFSSLGLNVLNELKRVVSEEEIKPERQTKKIKTN